MQKIIHNKLKSHKKVYIYNMDTFSLFQFFNNKKSFINEQCEKKLQ